ncbi:MAG TPA: hypothetical protein VGS79_15520 [Puia sp.]|nr:hypothetical protein [Puia sp.]
MDQALDQPIELKDPKLKDVANSWVDTSAFLFYLYVLIVIALVVGGSYGLYAHRYMGKPDVEVPGNTLYTPQYK